MKSDDGVYEWKAVVGGKTNIPSNSVSRLNVNATDYGAIGNGISDDTAAIQRAINAIANARKGDALELPPGTYRITSSLTIDSSYVSIVSRGATIDASAITSGAALRVTGTVNPPYKQSTTVLEGFKLVGNSQNGSVTGIRFHTDGGNGQGSSHITVRNVNISNFGIGLDYGDRAYAINHYGIDVYSCGICINQGGNIIDGGEKFNFNGCAFFNSGLAVKVMGDAANFTFTSCSFDYNARQFDVFQTRVFLNNCHIEASDYNEAPIKIASDAYMDIQGTWLLLTAGLPHKLPYFVNLIDSNSACHISNCFANNLKTSTEYWATGKGQFMLDHIHSYEITQNPLLNSVANNLMADGGFERTTIVDNIFITADTSPITNRYTGSNLTLSTSTATRRSGTRSLSATKALGANTAAAFVIAVPISIPQSVVNGSIWFNKSGTGGSGSITIENGWATLSSNSSSVPTILNQQVRGSLSYNLTSSASGWIQHNDGEPFVRSPAWATHYFIRVTMTAWNSGGNNTIYFDDVEINIVG